MRYARSVVWGYLSCFRSGCTGTFPLIAAEVVPAEGGDIIEVSMDPEIGVILPGPVVAVKVPGTEFRN